MSTVIQTLYSNRSQDPMDPMTIWTMLKLFGLKVSVKYISINIFPRHMFVLVYEKWMLSKDKFANSNRILISTALVQNIQSYITHSQNTPMHIYNEINNEY